MNRTADRPPVLLFLIWFCGLLGVTLGLVLLSTVIDEGSAQARGGLDHGAQNGAQNGADGGMATRQPAPTALDQRAGDPAPPGPQR